MTDRHTIDVASFNPHDNGGEAVTLTVEHWHGAHRVINIEAQCYGSSESRLTIHHFDAEGLDDVIRVLQRLRDEMRT